MGKKVRRNAKQQPAPAEAANRLPQNILAVGERVLDDRNIYILQSVYKAIAKFTKDKTTNESGGILVGTSIEELGKTNIMITGFIEAKHCESTPTTLKFTHETWEYSHSEMEKRFKGQKMVGWIHTHPDFGVFLSEYDKFIHQNFFSEDYQVAYVVDPIQKSEGFFYWINGSIERCPGFYIYDEVGKRIVLPSEPVADSDKPDDSWGALFTGTNIAIATLSVIVVLLLVSVMNMNGRIAGLERQIQMQQAVTDGLRQELQDVERFLMEATQPPASPDATGTPAPETTGTAKP